MKRFFVLLATLSAVHLSPASAQTVVFDPHVDFPPSAASPGWTGRSDPTSQWDVERLQRGGLTAIGLALFVPQGARTRAPELEARWSIAARYAALRRLVDENRDRVELAASPADVRQAATRRRLAIVPTILNSWPLGDDLSAFDDWYARGVRIVGLVHLGHNQFADSSRPALPRGERPDAQGGLTALGETTIGRLNDLGILIDVSQLSDRSLARVLAISRTPVVATHSNARSRVDVVRNLTDEQLSAIAAKGGVVAVNAFSAYLRADSPAVKAETAALQREFGITDTGSVELTGSAEAEYTRRYYAIRAKLPKASVSDLVDMVDAVVARIGIDHVALSSDFNHGGGVVGWNDAGETANVTKELRQRGYSNRDIAKLWGENLLRVWQQAIDQRRIAR